MKTFNKIVQKAKRKYPYYMKDIDVMYYQRWKYTVLSLNKLNANQYKLF